MKGTRRCDLLKNIYLCGSNNNSADWYIPWLFVVICLKISIFVVATTTCYWVHISKSRCDLLKNIYLCGSNNNYQSHQYKCFLVVICLKISIFVVATTTRKKLNPTDISCDLLKNIYLCGSNNNYLLNNPHLHHVVICLKISIFVVATTTYQA